MKTAHLERRVEFPPDPSLDELLELCTGQAHREVLLLLARGRIDVTGLSRIVSVDMGQLSRFLHRLEQAGLASCTEDGRRRFYTLTTCVQVGVADGRTTLTLLGQGIKVAVTVAPHDLEQLDRALRET